MVLLRSISLGVSLLLIAGFASVFHFSQEAMAILKETLDVIESGVSVEAITPEELNNPEKQPKRIREASNIHFQSFEEYLQENKLTKDTYKANSWLTQRGRCEAHNFQGPEQLIEDGLQIVLQKGRPIAPTMNVGEHERAALCTGQKNEDWYLHEWINYHLALGFDDIYIFDDNDDNTDPDSKLRQLLSADHPHVHIFPVQHLAEKAKKQSAIVDTCIKIIKRRDAATNDKTVWASHLDTDEFVSLKKHQYLQAFLLDNCPLPHCASIGLNWNWFGTGNATYYANQPVTQRFMYRDPSQHTAIKSIFRIGSGRTKQSLESNEEFHQWSSLMFSEILGNRSLLARL